MCRAEESPLLPFEAVFTGGFRRDRSGGRPTDSRITRCGWILCTIPVCLGLLVFSSTCIGASRLPIPRTRRRPTWSPGWRTGSGSPLSPPPDRCSPLSSSRQVKPPRSAGARIGWLAVSSLFPPASRRCRLRPRGSSRITRWQTPGSRGCSWRARWRSSGGARFRADDHRGHRLGGLRSVDPLPALAGEERLQLKWVTSAMAIFVSPSPRRPTRSSATTSGSRPCCWASSSSLGRSRSRSSATASTTSTSSSTAPSSTAR